jgi:hypothetical protein
MFHDHYITSQETTQIYNTITSPEHKDIIPVDFGYTLLFAKDDWDQVTNFLIRFVNMVILLIKNL